jgi:glutamyl-tRNA reductase
VEPAVGGLDGCFLYDIDDLSQVVEANRQARQGEAARAERIVAEEVVKFGRWLESLEVVPTIAALNQKAEQIREAELARTLGDLELSPQEAAHLDSLTRAVVKKLLHDPIMFLKEGAHAKSSQTRREQLALVRRLFGLPEGQPPDEPPDRGGE